MMKMAPIGTQAESRSLQHIACNSPDYTFFMCIVFRPESIISTVWFLVQTEEFFRPSKLFSVRSLPTEIGAIHKTVDVAACEYL